MLSKSPPFWTKQLGLALIISVALHFLLVRGLGLEFPDWWKNPKTSASIIEAVLVPSPKPEPPKVALPEKLPVPAQKPVLKKRPKPPPPPQELPSLEAPNELPAPVTSPIPVVPVEAPPVAEPQPTSEGVVQNGEGAAMNDVDDDRTAPPLFVETDFDVTKDGSRGVIRTSYRVEPDGRYFIKSEAVAKGFISLFLGRLKQESEGIVTARGLKPSSYLYQYGDNEDKAQRASFDWQEGILTMQNGKKMKTAALPEGTQDFLSFMYQFMFVPPLEQMQLSIANGKKLGTYDYGFVGEEILSTKMGDLRTIHIFRSRHDKEEKTELWLAIEHHYLPVKVRQTEKDGSVIEQIATRVATGNTPNPSIQ